jgi:hypothetical protein
MVACTKVLLKLIEFNKKYNNNNFIPKSHKFVNVGLKSDLDLVGIIAEVNNLLPKLAGFIDQFNNVITQSGVNVITDSSGNMSIDVPQSMSDSEANNISKRIGIIDRLITTHGNSINDLFQKGLSIENKIKANNPNYVSELSDQIAQFKKLNEFYKH